MAVRAQPARIRRAMTSCMQFEAGDPSLFFAISAAISTSVAAFRAACACIASQRRCISSLRPRTWGSLALAC